MEIKIDSKARNYLEKNNINTFHIEAYIPKVCCGKANITPVVNIGEPKKNKKDYEKIDIENYEVYVQKPLTKEAKDLEITYEKYLFAGSLAISEKNAIKNYL